MIFSLYSVFNNSRWFKYTENINYGIVDLNSCGLNMYNSYDNVTAVELIYMIILKQLMHVKLI